MHMLHAETTRSNQRVEKGVWAVAQARIRSHSSSCVAPQPSARPRGRAGLSSSLHLEFRRSLGCGTIDLGVDRPFQVILPASPEPHAKGAEPPRTSFVSGGAPSHVACVDVASGQAAPVVPTPSSGPLDLLQDAFLFMGDFKILFYVTLVGFCIANARVVLSGSPKINYFHGCALMILMNYGGSTISAVMVGAPVAFVCNEALVPVCLAVWTVMYFLPLSATDFVKKSFAGFVLQSTTYEIMRCHVLMNCTKQAAALPVSYTHLTLPTICSV